LRSTYQALYEDDVESCDGRRRGKGREGMRCR
jgi:hypothetical protein